MLEKNLEALSKTNKKIYKWLTDNEMSLPEDISFVDVAKNGEPIVGMYGNPNTIYLNSRYNPSNEASKYMEDYLDMPDQSILVMFGLGNGSFAREFVKNHKNKMSIMIYEPSLDIFLKVINSIDISDIITNPNTFLFVNGINAEDISYVLTDNLDICNMKTNKYIECPKYKDIFAEEYEKYHKIVYESNMSSQMRINTYAVYGRQMCLTVINNMRFLPGCRSVMSYADMFSEDMPAVIVSAGPSLVKNIDLLKTINSRALIIAVDHALPALLARDIYPDIVVCVDNEKPVEIFEGLDTSKLMFFAESAMHHKVLEYLKPENLVFYSAATMTWGKLFEQVGSEIRTVFSGGTVAIEALMILMIMGIRKVILIGQDLALTGGKYYADIEEDTEKYRTVPVEGINGEELYTTRSFLAFIRCFENLAAIHKDLELVDATEGGALIKNTKIMTFKEAIDKYCKEEYPIREMLLKPERLFLGEDRNLVEDTYVNMIKNLKDMDELFSSASKRGAEGVKLLKSKDYKVSRLKKINSVINEADQRYTNSDEMYLLKRWASGSEYLMFTDLYQKQEKEDIKETIRLYEKCEKFFFALSNASKDLVVIAEDALKKFRNES